MRLRVIKLPESPNRAPYLLVLDKVPFDCRDALSGLNEGLTERTAGLCHGILAVEGELEIE